MPFPAASHNGGKIAVAHIKQNLPRTIRLFLPDAKTNCFAKSMGIPC